MGYVASRILILIAGDILAGFFALFIAFCIRFGGPFRIHDLSNMDALRVVLFVSIMILSSFFTEIYNINRELDWKESGSRILVANVISFFILSSIYFMAPVVMYGRGLLILSLAIHVALQFAWHLIYYISSKFSGFARRVLILGTGPLAQQMGGLIAVANNNYVLSGYVNCASELSNIPFKNIVGNHNELYATALRERVHKIVVSLSERRGIFPLQHVLDCKMSGIEVVDAPAFYEQVTGKLLIENITPSWFIFSQGFRVTALLRIVKRTIDLLSALFILLLVLPFLPIIALIIKLDSSGPILFKQVRVGERENSFVLYKFRTMGVDAEKNSGAVWAVKDDPRVTRVGEFLRKSRIDEIPQLFNVLLGNMSLVGPRPERPEFVEKLKEIIPYYSERHFVKPGVTGWAQVRYPYGASVEDAIEKLRYDLYYIKNLRATFDLMIILETIKVVLFRRGGR
jgi:sugar transferase (PEP-CTERM system associated)